MAHFLPLLPNESHKEREASIFQRSHQPGCSISLWWGSSEVFLFFLPGRHSDHLWTQEARELDRQDAESLIVERLPFSDSTKSACLNYLAELKKKNVFLNCCSSGCHYIILCCCFDPVEAAGCWWTLVPWGFGLRQAGAAYWSRADISKWALKTPSVVPLLWECPAGVASTGGFGYPDTHQLHLRLLTWRLVHLFFYVSSAFYSQ